MEVEYVGDERMNPIGVVCMYVRTNYIRAPLRISTSAPEAS